ncbi:MAG: sigma-E factor negative regulatory protein [Gallionellaceae bacterium]|nr:MAG: sigma-E factor negative regulatory protein [Gallionellaceae bacterium]
MLETRAIVVHVQGNEALVEAKGGGGCGNCDSEKGCGSGKLSQMFCSKPRQFKVHNEADARVGDEVQITLPDGVLLRSSIIMYVMPLSLLLSGGMLGSHWASDTASRDIYASIGSLLGLIGGFLLARWISKRQLVAAVARPVIPP